MRSINLGDAEIWAAELVLHVSQQRLGVCFLVRKWIWISVQEGGGLFFLWLKTEGPSRGNSGLYRPDGATGLGNILGLTSAKQWYSSQGS